MRDPDSNDIEAEVESAELAANPSDLVEASASDDFQDRWLRTAAELDNVRKRRSRDIEAARQREREPILRDLAGISDNLDRAIRSSGDNPAAWMEGVTAIQRQVLDTLKKHGVEPFNPVGQPFDPHFHEAVGSLNLPDQPEGTVAEVLELGYQMAGGGILRHARVIVVHHE